MGEAPPNHLALAIVTTVACCLPLGILGIVKSSQVQRLWERGDVAGAIAASKSAKAWSTTGLVIGLVITVAYFLFYAALLSSTSGY